MNAVKRFGEAYQDTSPPGQNGGDELVGNYQSPQVQSESRGVCEESCSEDSVVLLPNPITCKLTWTMLGPQGEEHCHQGQQEENSKKRKKDGRAFCCYYSLLCKTILFEALLLLAYGIFIYVVVSQNERHTTTLAVTNEKNSDSLNDNPKGIPLDLFTLKKTIIKHHSYLYHQTNFEHSLSITGVNRFIMPYNYYNRPWYLWEGSDIEIAIEIIGKERLTEVIFYLIKGEASIHSFLSEEESIPMYERQIDVLPYESNSVHLTVQYSDYYYVAVHTVGSKDIIFKANITFNFIFVTCGQLHIDKGHCSECE